VRSGTKFRRPESTAWRLMSQFHSLSDDEIFDSLQAEANFIRTCPIDSSTKFAVIGIPADSLYSNPRRITVITDLLRNVGLQPVLFGSPTCDEIQIYLFFKEVQKTNLITQALINLLVSCGLQVSSENLIVYGEEHDLVLPLQQGFSWLTDSLQAKVCRNEISFESALAMFMNDVVKSSTPVDQLLNFQAGVINSEIGDREIHYDFNPSDELNTLIDQVPEIPRISLFEDVDSERLIDQSVFIAEVLITQNTQSEDAGLIKSSDNRKEIIRTLPTKKAPSYEQMTLPVLEKPKVKSNKGKKSKTKNRRTKRGPPDQ